MKAKFFISILLTLCLHISFSQLPPKLIIKKVINKGGYDYIPLSYLSDSTDGIIYTFREIGKVKTTNKIFKIHWNSRCIDGTYNLTITPLQIYLTSSHENPNPNMLYWVLNIDSLTFDQIVKGFQKSKLGQNKSASYSYFDEIYDDAYILSQTYNSAFEDSCNVLRDQQIDKFFLMLNKYIITNSCKISKSQRVIPINRIFFGESKQMIIDSQLEIIDIPKKDQLPSKP